jgi:tRNA(fMet)-specific endonuclease VapC
MTVGEYVLDTNLFVAYFNSEQAVVDKIIAAHEVWLPAVALGELQYGAVASQKPQENLARIRDLMTWASVLVCDDVTALYYGRIKASLRAKGRLIPDNDIWIAATAMQADLPLISRDEHFQQVEDIRWEAW